MTYRTEHDLLGERQIPADSYTGIHTLRALENFSISAEPLHPHLFRAVGLVKQAAVEVNHELGYIAGDIFAPIYQACSELAAGGFDHLNTIPALQGGAGTSANMTVNEIIANRALEIMGHAKGSYHIIHPLNQINLHQSTNDVFPTALKVAAMQLLTGLEQAIVALQEAFQLKMQDAVLTTLGQEMASYAEALARDRWRIYKCNERLRVINLGGTAIGTAIGAPRKFVFMVSDRLRTNTALPLARAEHLIENTQNADVYVEVSGILKACASSLFKICNDIRFMSSGPNAGIGELSLKPLQAGSSIMPGKVNPVAAEAVMQIGMAVNGYDQMIFNAASMGNLELNAFMPLIAHALLNEISLLTDAANIANTKLVSHLKANEAVCRQHIESSTATLTALVPLIGYEKATEAAQIMSETGLSAKAAAMQVSGITSAQFDEAVSPEAVLRLGF